MKYYLGPWILDTSDGEPTYRAPTGTIGAIDLGILPEMGVATATRRGCLCWTSGGPLPAEWDLIGEGDCRSINLTAAMQSKFMALVGYRPKGDRLHDAIMDCLIGGADPDGSNGPVPIVPDTMSLMDLWLPGHGRVISERFEWGKPTSRGNNHTGKLRTLLRKQFQNLFDDANAGRLRDGQHHRRVLDAWCEKYKVGDWKEFVPLAIQKDVPGRLPHETTVSDDFNRADSTGLGANWTNMNASGFDVVSNQARGTNASSSNTKAQYNTNLSSTDHDCQIDVIAYGIGLCGPLTRGATGADTGYLWIMNAAGSPPRRVIKHITGTSTTLASDSTTPPSPTFTSKMRVNGSSLKVYIDGVEETSLAVTDTSITSGLRGGMRGQQHTTVASRSLFDNFVASDISAGGGILYTQMERGTRGLHRGLYTKW